MRKLSLAFVLLLGLIALSALAGRADAYTTTGTLNVSPSSGLHVGDTITISMSLTTDMPNCPMQSQMFQGVVNPSTFTEYQQYWTLAGSPTGSGQYAASTTYKFQVADTYTVTVVGWCGAADGQYYGPVNAVVVVANPLSASITSSTTVTAGMGLYFTSQVSGGNGAYTYSWTFGDGGTSTQADPFHTFMSVGTFTVTLTVSDESGQQRSASTVIVVTASTPPPDQGIAGMSVPVIVGLVVAAVAAAGVTIFAVMRRKKRPTPAWVPPPPPGT